MTTPASWLGRCLADGDGDPSSMRLLTVIVVCTVLSTWAYSVVRAGTWIPLDLETVAALASALGGKALQAGFELRAPHPPHELDGAAQ